MRRRSPTVLVDDNFFEQLRRDEYDNLDKHQQVYLDYTGGNLCPRSLVFNHQRLLLENILGNPHSSNPTSQRSTYLIESARSKVLEFFNAQDYTCVFTPNASAALKIVGESYPFDETSTLLLLCDNHNSVNGIREFCSQRGGITKYFPVQLSGLAD
ncbi:MAG: aminotransferase class V-fold PLP-dependent enzyme [Chryseolinea sp.]